MRAAAAALALGLLLVAAGCGNGTAATGTSSGTDAASLVPASALVYVSADANLDSQSWQVVTDLFGPLDSKFQTRGSGADKVMHRGVWQVIALCSGRQ